ncbi:hypothetical protein [Corynebacterium callunae]|nr:hypothetical protein [Corynebacterium callunae]
MSTESFKAVKDELTEGLKIVDSFDELKAFLEVANWIVYGK